MLRPYYALIGALVLQACDDTSQFATAQSRTQTNDRDIVTSQVEDKTESDSQNQNKPIPSSPIDSIVIDDTDNNKEPTTPKPMIDPIDIPALCATLEQQIKLDKLDFAARKSCDFGENGNLEKKDRYVQARSVESQVIDLPENALICDMSIQSRSSKLHYDDFIFFTLNEQVLIASNEKLLNSLPQIQEQYYWNWDQIRGSKIRDFEAESYCISDAQCTIPPHDEVGRFDLELSTESMIFSQIAAKAFDKGAAEFKLITTGDDNNKDCMHSDFELDLQLKYVIPSQSS